LAKAVKLDRKTKTALAGLLLIILVLLAMVIRNSIVSVASDSLVAEQSPQTEDEIVQVGTITLLLRRGSAGNKIAHWIDAGSKGSRAFQVSQGSFVPNSDNLTNEGEQRADNFAEMMSHASDVDARILISMDKVDPRLTQLRAQHLRSELVGRGISASRIEVSAQPIKGGNDLSDQPELVVLLSTH